MKKKFIFALLLVVLLAVTLSGCKIKPGDSTILYDPKDGMEIVKDANSYDLIKQAYNYFQNCSQYKMTIDFVFNTAPDFAYQVTQQEIIRTDNEYYESYAARGTGAADKDEKSRGNQFYYNISDSVVSARYIAKDKISLDKKNNKLTAEFSDATWGEFNVSEELDGINTPMDRVNKYKSSLHQYNWLNENNISSKTDNLVYSKNNKYYCTIKIDTTSGNIRETQPAVVKAIEDATEGNLEKFLEDTRIVVEMEKIDNAYRFTQFILMEDYVGKQKGIISLNISQQYWHKFYYGTNDIVIPNHD